MSVEYRTLLNVTENTKTCVYNLSNYIIKYIFFQMDDVIALTDMSHQDITPRIANLEKHNKDLQGGTYIISIIAILCI